MALEPNEPVDTIARGEPRNCFDLVFPDPACELGGQSDIQRSIGLAREQLDVEHCSCRHMDPGLRRETIFNMLEP